MPRSYLLLVCAGLPPARRFVRCGRCRQPITGSRATSKTGRRYAYYWCRAAGCRAIKATATARLEADFIGYLNQIAPKSEYIELFTAIIADAWKAKTADAETATREISRQLDELRARKDRLVEAFVYQTAIDRATYEQHMDKLDEQITLAEMRLEDARLDEIDLDGVLNFAQHLLKDVGRLWFEASTEQKQRLQQVLFPKGVEYLDGKFRTPEISLIFSIFHTAEGAKEGEASPTGFEPGQLGTAETPEEPEKSSDTTLPHLRPRTRRQPRTSHIIPHFPAKPVTVTDPQVFYARAGSSPASWVSATSISGRSSRTMSRREPMATRGMPTSRASHRGVALRD